MCKKCAIDIYSEGIALGVKTELRNPWLYIGEGGTLFCGFYGMLWFYNLF